MSVWGMEGSDDSAFTQHLPPHPSLKDALFFTVSLTQQYNSCKKEKVHVNYFQKENVHQ